MDYSYLETSIFNKLNIQNQETEFEDIIDEEYEYVNTDYNVLNQDIYYPQPDFELWESLLNRQLQNKERKIIHDYLLEKDTNLQIKTLHNNMLSNGYFFIPKLTKNNGNCLWECLSILGYGKASEIRKNIAALLLLVKNDWNFFPNRDTCPEELFINCNDVELVRDKNTGLVYEYDYDMMVLDLYSNHSWNRLPMELILMTVSRVYEINFKIFSNNSDYINKISIDNLEEENIYLGHINEEHYLPIIKIDDELENDPVLLLEYLNTYPIYTSAKKNYDKWAKSFFIDDVKEDKKLIDEDLLNDLKEIKDFNDFEIIE